MDFKQSVEVQGASGGIGDSARAFHMNIEARLVEGQQATLAVADEGRTRRTLRCSHAIGVQSTFARLAGRAVSSTWLLAWPAIRNGNDVWLNGSETVGCGSSHRDRMLAASAPNRQLHGGAGPGGNRESAKD
jgi:hypothetical protein